MILRSRACVGALALALLVPAMAFAQAPAPRNPFVNLFGRAPERTGREYTAVQFRSNVGVQRGRLIEREADTEDAVIPEGVAGGADVALTADYIRDRVQLAGRGRYSYQEYRRTPAFGAPAFDAGVRLLLRPTTRLALDGSANFSRSPYFQLLWLAPATESQPQSPADSAILLMQNETFEGAGRITHNYTNRSSIELSGAIRQTDFAFSPQKDLSAIGGLAMWQRKMSRNLAIHAGYGRDQFQQRLSDRNLLFTNERIDVGVDYGRSLALARRTTLGFGTETSLLSENGGPRRFRLNGHVGLDHRFGRSTWQMQLAARRGTEFMPGFRTPVYTDAGHASLAGYLGKRLLVNVRADGGQAQAGLVEPRKFTSYSGSTKLTLALSRHLGLFGQYLYYHYQSPADPLTLFSMPSGARDAITIGIETWVSIFDKEKVKRDPR